MPHPNKNWRRVECFFCNKLMPAYAPGTMIRRATTADPTERYICSRCYRKVVMVMDNAETVRQVLLPDKPPDSEPGKRIVEV